MALTKIEQAGIADDAVDIAQIKAGSDGELISYDASGNPVKIAAGTSGHFLKSQGNASQPVFAAIPASGISDVVSDTTPQLGGDLDIQASKITTSTTDGNIVLDPNGSGVVSVDSNLTLADSKQLLIGDTSDLVIDHTGSHSRIVEQGDGDLQISSSSKVAISTSSGNGDITLTPNGTGDLILGQGDLKWPQADGNAGQFLKTDGSEALSWATVATDYTSIASNVLPDGDNTRNLGSSTKRWANVYVGDIELSNEGSKNDVDGSWGKWTIQEGEDHLYLINRRSGQKYRFLLRPVTKDLHEPTS